MNKQYKPITNCNFYYNFLLRNKSNFSSSNLITLFYNYNNILFYSTNKIISRTVEESLPQYSVIKDNKITITFPFDHFY